MEALRDMRLPPGFGFHPSDAELISHYLKRKVHGQRIEHDLIPEVDIYKHEPWDLPSKCNLPIEDNKWHFFASRDRKYPTGGRSNRATRAGYWKSTGKDRAIKLSKRTLGTKKTLVFHEGRPPSGRRTEWIMHEYYIDENECQVSPDMKDAFVLCRVTRRDEWALENDNGVGNRNPHPQHSNDTATSVVIAAKRADPATSVVIAAKQEDAGASVVIAEKHEDAATSGTCAGEPNHLGTPVSAELSNDVAQTAFMAHSPNSNSDLQAWMDSLLFSPNPVVDTGSAGLSLIELSNDVGTPASAELSNDVAQTAFMAYSPNSNSESELQAFMDDLLFSLNPEVDTGSAGLSLIEQNVEPSNPGFMAPKVEPDHASPTQNGIDDTNYLFHADVQNILSEHNNDLVTMMETDHVAFPNNPEGTQNEELQLYQGSCYANLSNENADNGIAIRRRSVTAFSASSSPSTGRIKLQVGVNRMVTSNSETINQIMMFAGNSGHMRSFKQSDATKPSEHNSNEGNSDATRSSENLSNQGHLRGRKGVFRSSAVFNILFACVCMIGVIAAVLHGCYRSGISL